MTHTALDETVLMGMGIQSVTCAEGGYEIRTPGAAWPRQGRLSNRTNRTNGMNMIGRAG